MPKQKSAPALFAFPIFFFLLTSPLSSETMNDDNWDLHAVVRSCVRAATTPFSHAMMKDQLASSPSSRLTPTDELLISHHAFNELEEIWRPFCSTSPPHHLNPKPPSLLGRLQKPKPRPMSHSEARYKRRKSQVKKVVCHVPADEVCSDVWAWRKYGQKPIKGSPFPRGYYKCSSLKGCPARKLVERCRNDPNSFIVTYTAEHNHAVPVHRNCLAGSTRNKPARSGEVDGDQGSMKGKEPSPSGNDPDAVVVGGLSPTTPLVVIGEEEVEDMEAFMAFGEELEEGIGDISCYSW